MSAKGSRKGCKIALLIFLLPVLLILILPSLWYIVFFLNKAIALKSQAAVLMQIKNAFEKRGMRAAIIPGETNEVFMIEVSPANQKGPYGIGTVYYFTSANKEELVESRKIESSSIMAYQKDTNVVETTIVSNEGIIYTRSIVAPDRATSQQAEIVQSTLKATKISGNRWFWNPIAETKVLWFTNWAVLGGPIDNPFGKLVQLMLQPGKWFCYILAPILGFTPYYLLFIWPLALLAGVAVYIKHRLKPKRI